MSEEYDFRIYKSNRLENFLPEVFAIIERLAGKAPLEKKEIIVQSEGMARWLVINATRKEGAFANFKFIEPDKFLRSFAAKHFGMDPGSFYNKKKAEWELYSLLRNEKNSPAASYIGNNDSRAFRFSRTLADLFEQYFVYRPKMMECWLNGKTMTGDPDEQWQFEIFRRLAEKTEVKGFAQLFNEKCRNARKSGDYPEELVLFGISIMNRYHLNMFLNLSRLFPIRLFAMTPSREFCRRSKQKGRFLDPEENNGEFDTFFGRFCAASLDFIDFTAENLPDEADFFEEPDGKTLLSSIRRDILNDAELPEKAENDDSVRIISCRDKMREIEVLKDTLLELFNSDESLKPEDVAVMAPKINDYVPYISAVFGGTDPHDDTFIPYEISDRAFSSESRIASTFLEILKLGKSGFEKSKVLSVFNIPAVRTKFGTDEKTVGEIGKLIDNSGIRWGLDAASRNGKNNQNTWDSGLSRIMMSCFMPFPENGECFDNILPMEYFSKEDFENISGFLTFAKELFRSSAELPLLKTPEKFRNKLEEMLDFFFAGKRNDNESDEEIRHIRNVIDDFAETANDHEVSFDALLQYLEDELGREQTGKGFLSAKVNFCSLKPLRALPFKVIYIIGMGDGEFPRSENRYAFDLSQKRHPEEKDAPRPRSVRDNDKYLFAEAVVSAREKLFTSYEAKDLSSDSKKHRSAALPVQILEKYIEKKTGTEAEKLEIKYPVQPFSPEYFEKNSGFKTFSKKDYAIARAMFHVEQNPPSLLPKETSEEISDSCEETETEIIDLEKLISFFKDPAKYYFTKNLKMVFPDDSEEKGDEELFDYSDNLLAYNVRKTYIDMAKSMPEEFYGEPDKFERTFIDRMKCEGKIPFGTFGEASLKAFINDSSKGLSLRGLAGNIAGKTLDFQPVSIDFGYIKKKLEGTIQNIERPDRMIFVCPSKSGAKYKIEALIRHLSANAGGTEFDTEFICNNKNFLLERMSEEEAKFGLLNFVMLWHHAKKEMPLCAPDLIEEFIKPVREAGTGNMSKEAVNEIVTSFFEKKWRTRNDVHSFPSQGFLLTTEQFLDPGQTERFLERFPADEVQETASLLDKFYQKQNKKKK